MKKTLLVFPLLILALLINAQQKTSIKFTLKPNTEYLVGLPLRFSMQATKNCDDVYKFTTDNNGYYALNIDLESPRLMITSISTTDQSNAFLEPNNTYNGSIGSDGLIILNSEDDITNNQLHLLNYLYKNRLLRTSDIQYNPEGYSAQDSVMYTKYHLTYANTNEKVFCDTLKYYQQKRQQILDSALENKKISPFFYRYFTNFFMYEYLKTHLDYVKENSINDKVLNFKNVASGNVNGFTFLQQLINCDSCVQYSSYNDLLYSYIKIIAGNRLEKMGKDPIDTKFWYDTASVLLTGESKNFYLYWVLTGSVLRNKTCFNDYCKKFYTDCTNSKYYKYVKALEAKVDYYNEKSTVLSSVTNIKSTLGDHLKNYKGNYVFIDLWASWCGPCRKSFEVSRRLEKQFAQSPIKFIYLSIDSDINKWKKAVADEKLNAANCFLIEKGQYSNFARKINLQGIPHYILLDKDGTVVSENMTHPTELERSHYFETLFSHIPQ